MTAAGPSGIAPVFLTVQVVIVRVLAVVRLLARGARLLEGRPRSGGGGRGLVREDFVGEDVGGNWRKRGYPALEVVPTAL